MNSKLYNRLVDAHKRLEAMGLQHVTVTLPIDVVLSVNGSVQEYIADTMERQATMYENMDDTGTPVTDEYKKKLDLNCISHTIQQKGKTE